MATQFYLIIDTTNTIIAQYEVRFERDLAHLPSPGSGQSYVMVGSTSPYEPPNPYITALKKWNPTTLTIYYENTATLAEYKAAKTICINESRLTANKTSFTYLTKEIACDDLSRSDIDAANGTVCLTGAFPEGWPGGWKAIDNTYVPLTTISQWAAFYGAMVAQGTANFNKSQSLKATLASYTEIGDVLNTTW